MATVSSQTELSVEVKELPAVDYLGKNLTAPAAAVGKEVSGAFAQLYGAIAKAGVTPAGPPFLIASEPAGGTMEIEVGAPCMPVPEPDSGLHRGRLEACRAAVTVHHGTYEAIGPVYSRLFAWLFAHGHKAAGKAREVYLNGPDDVATPDDYLTELIVPIT
ncbi:MAG TPA: GyrI-like domain-containing protein [Patescibacteria group bacterium]|nr:GyrI-like domain-containing protein [Patescibacteria group bacterium]